MAIGTKGGEKKRNAPFEASGQRCYRWRGDELIIAENLAGVKRNK